MSRYDALYRIEAPHMVAGLGIGIDGLVNWSAPILGYMLGWDYQRVSDYCKGKRWTLEKVGGYP
jgi:hypothetical protein